jgi:hypothetical protein
LRRGRSRGQSSANKTLNQILFGKTLIFNGLDDFYPVLWGFFSLSGLHFGFFGGELAKKKPFPVEKAKKGG